MKRLLPILLIFGLISAQAQQKRSIYPIPRMVADANYRIGCSLFTDPNNYTTGSSFSYSAPVNNNSYLTGPNGANYDCLYSVPNQAWFIITVTNGGNLSFNFSNSNDYDVDAAIWGPISNNDMANACAATLNTPISCDYDGTRPDLYISNAQAGQKYVMVVSNYSNANTTINISQPSGGGVTYAMVNLPNCSIIPTATLSGTSTTITEGQPVTLNLSFTGSAPWNYTLSDGTMGTAYTSPASINVYPTASQTFTINSVSNLCGTGGGTGSVGISVLRSLLLKSCFPLNGNAIDSTGSNNGTLQNGVFATTNRNSEANKALQFDGINDYVSIPTNQLNNTTFSVAAWVKLDELPTNVNTERVILSLGGISDEHYLGVEYYNGAPSWKFFSNDSKVYSTAIVNTDWHLLVAVRTGGVLKLYVDGVLTGSTSASGTATYSSPLSGRIGSSIAGNKFLKGKVDDIKIFNGSLIDPEILLLQNSVNCNDVINDSYISIQSVSTSLICTNSPFIVRGITNNLSIETGTSFVAELSDESGNFNNPTIIGSSEFLPLTVNIPNTVTGGSHKLRIRYGSVISINTFDIFVNKSATYNITGTTTINDGQSANISLNFTGTGPWNYVLSTGLSGAATTSPWVIPVTPDQSTTYTIISTQNVCSNATPDGNTSATITVNFTKQNVTCLPFNGNATDQKANNTTTVNGALLTENRYGQTNSAFAFNGTSNYIEYTTNLLRKREYTMSAWVLANTISGGTQYVLSQGEIGTYTFQGLALTNSGWQFISYSNGGAYTATSTTNWAANQWVHLTAVRTYQQLRLYVNGNLVANTYSADNIPFKTSDIGRIGANSSGLGNYFNGKIDDVRLYKGALNDEEVYALYANTGNCPTIENSPIILVKSLSPTTICAGNSISVNYTSSSITPTGGSPLKVQLSDQNGSFTNPTVIGSGISSPIAATIPINAPNSSLYKVRIVSSDATPVTSITTATLNVSGALPTATISGGGNIPYGGSANLTITFTGTSPWTYAINNGTSQTTSTNPLTIPVSPTSTTTYNITTLYNSCGAGSGSGSATVTVAPNIILGSIANSFCYGQSFDVSFTPNYTPVSSFKVELSNAAGSFASPVTIGTGTSSPISVTIPANTPGGTAYKIRVVTTSPVYTGPESASLTIIGKATATISGTTTIDYGQATNLTVTFSGTGPWTYAINNGSSQTTSTNPLTIPVSPTSTTTYAVTSVSNSCGSGTVSGSAVITVRPNIILGGIANSFCNGETFTVPFTANYTPTPNFKVELSDASGSFASPTIIGTGTSSPVSVTIPNGTSYGTGYKIRIASTSPIYISPESSAFTINVKATATITGNTTIDMGQSANFTVTFAGNAPWTYKINNGSSQITSTSPLTVTVSPTVTTTYTITSLSNTCGTGTATGSAVITVNPTIILGAIGANFCEGQTISVPFTLNFTPVNALKLELSDSTGSFTNPLVLGTGTVNTISGVIPTSITGGTRYKVRIVSTSPAAISSLSNNILLKKKPTATISGTTSIIEDFSADLTINFTGAGPWIYKINNGSNQTATVSPAIVSVSPTSNANYSLTSVSNTCGIGTYSGNAAITVTHEPYLVSCYPFNGNANDSKGINNGVSYGGVSLTTDRFNTPNSAYLFDGFDDYIQLPINRMGNMSAYSVSLWVHTTTYAHPNGENLFTVIPNGVDGTMHSLLFTNWDVNVEQTQAFYRIPCGDNSCATWFPQTFAINTWHNIVVTRQGSALRLYKNGVLVSSVTQTGTNFDAAMDNLMAFLGKKFRENSAGSDGGYFKGKIDDVQIYKRALTAAQVTALYNQTSCDDVAAIPFVNLVSVSKSEMCKGQNVSIQYSSQKTAALIKVELSDSGGSFATPIVIGSGTTSPIVAQIPANQEVGIGYKIRLVSSDNVAVISNISQTLSVNSISTASLTGNTTINEGQSTNLTINFTGSAPWTYKINNGTSQVTSTNPLSVSVSPITTTTYTITSLSNTCGNGTASGSVPITVLNIPFLISCYSFNGNMTDGKGDNNGTLSGITYTTDRFNTSASALSFVGNNSHSAIIPLDELSNTSAYTISLWFSVATHESYMYGRNIFALMPPYNTQTPSESISNADWLVSRTNFGEEITKIAYGNNYSGFISELYTTTLNTWYHLVLTRQNNVVKLYQNGVLLNTKTVSAGNSNLGNLKGYIGKGFGSSADNALGEAFKGKIDDIQIYRNALSAGQIQALFKNSKTNINACFDAAKFTCLADITYNAMLEGKQVLSVKNQIIGSSTIQTGSNIYFDAKNSILLTPGFKTENNTVFTAQPGEGCID